MNVRIVNYSMTIVQMVMFLCLVEGVMDILNVLMVLTKANTV